MSLPVTAESRSAEPDQTAAPERRMDRRRLKSYAPKARTAFMAGVKARAAKLGIHGQDGIDPIKEEGDIAIIGGHPYPRKLADQRRKLIERIQARGFDQVIEEIAYTWFNRFAAIRYMEIHGYLSHGLRVLSHPRGEREPEILQQAQHITLPGLSKEIILNLKLDNKDEELYRRLIIGQCNALHDALPFLFEKIDDETELLLPDNLLHTESLIRQLVDSVPEEDWQETEVIGWLYQFYISEKKDKLMAAKKAYKSEDIPAVTQLFTPNWIVQYMVQNSLGHLWMATYPASGLKSRMPYYIEPAEQTEEVKAQLAAITPKSLNPEELTLLDPACGSGHILLEGYNLLKDIYMERGYPLKDIPRLILEKNLYGIDIDDRAAQLSGFALLMRARADDKRIIDNPPYLNIIAIQDSKNLSAKDIAQALLPKGPSAPVKSEVQEGTIESLITLFVDAKTFGSLIIVPDNIMQALPSLKSLIAQDSGADMFKRKAIDALVPLVRQADFLARKYDAVVANPPYMGAGYFNESLKEFIGTYFKIEKSDLCTCFISRCISFSKKDRYIGMITVPSWMFLSSFSKFRKKILSDSAISTFNHIGRGVWGSDFGSCAFTILNTDSKEYIGVYKRLFDSSASVASNRELIGRFLSRNNYFCSTVDLEKIPETPIAYWASKRIREIFTEEQSLSTVAAPRQGLATGDNEKFLRYWHECSSDKVGANFISRDEARNSGKKWFPCNKGGGFRKWFGNNYIVVNWENDGHEIQNFKDSNGKLRSRPQNKEYYFRSGITWTTATIGDPSFRFSPAGHLFETKGSVCFPNDVDSINYIMGLLNSYVSKYCLGIISPTVDYHEGPLGRVPVLERSAFLQEEVDSIVSHLIEMTKKDWNSYETSWDYSRLPYLCDDLKTRSLKESYEGWRSKCATYVQKMIEMEEENNRLFINAYGLRDDLFPSISLEKITLTVNPTYRYAAGLTEQEYETRFLSDSMKELISYAIGCMMGRYSLDASGLIYAQEGNRDFDSSQYKTFPADNDGIIPVTELDWFEDDAVNRFADFLKAVWGKDTLEQNLRFVAEALESKRDENAMETIRRYIGSAFFKDHLKTYKSRPIYWLFSSGKEKAFECLVYLHRYNEGTLAKIRMDYVVPLLNRFHARIDALNQEAQNAASATVRRRVEKEREKLQRQKVELQSFDDKLRHYADQRIAIDLDDGVKVNYGKFGDLLAEVKKVTGQKDDQE